jgi:hypothetical protein
LGVCAPPASVRQASNNAIRRRRTGTGDPAGWLWHARLHRGAE